MPDDLGARLLRAGLCTRDQLGEALARRASAGGALAAALTECGVSEAALAGFFVAQGYGPLLEARDLSAAEPDALRRTTGDMARALLALPVRSSPGGLVVAMADPSDGHAVEELRFATGSKVVPTVARVADLSRAIEQAYPRGLFLNEESAVIELVQRRSAVPQVVAPVEPTPQVVAPVEPTPPVRDTASYRAPALDPPSDLPPPFPDLDTGELAVEAPPRTLVDTPGPDGERASAPPADLVAADRWSDLGRRSSRPPPARVSKPALREGPRRPLPPRPPSVPPDASAPLTAIRAASSRDEVVALACEAATTIARAAVFLALKGGMWKGIDGVGGRVSRDAIKNLFIPVGSPSMFKRVAEELAPYRGRYGTTAADNLFRAAIGSRGGEVVVQPIVISERVVALLCADDVQYGDVGARRLEAVAHAVAEAFKRLIVHSKSIPP